jgi:hypothetical protein
VEFFLTAFPSVVGVSPAYAHGPFRLTRNRRGISLLSQVGSGVWVLVWWGSRSLAGGSRGARPSLRSTIRRRFLRLHLGGPYLFVYLNSCESNYEVAKSETTAKKRNDARTELTTAQLRSMECSSVTTTRGPGLIRPAQCVSGLKNHVARRKTHTYIRDGATRINGRECSSRVAWPDVFRSQGRADISGRTLAQPLALFLQKSWQVFGGQELVLDSLSRKRRDCTRGGRSRTSRREW